MKTIKIIMMPIFILLAGCTICVSENQYEYIDLYGNKGISKNCYEGYKAGGLYCEFDKDGVIQVLQYKVIESKEVCQ